ncbi:MAG: ribose 5-phosphate isomerase B [Planctomycetota bacterium]
MKLVLGSDHAGLETKLRLQTLLRGDGHEVEDLGTHTADSVDYPDYAHKVAQAVRRGSAQAGILVCGTGIGMSIAANRTPGVRAAKCNDPYEARMSRAHNDANVLCLGARVVDATVVDEIVRLFLATPFEGGRHARRVAKFDAPAPAKS